MAENQSGWDQYQRLVIYRLTETDKKIEDIHTMVNELVTSVALLKFKVALIGSAAGIIAGLVGTGFVEVVKAWTK